MFNYKAIIEKKLHNIEKLQAERGFDCYSITIPVIAHSTQLKAYVLTVPGMSVEYKTGDQVVVAEIDSSNEYIILGLLQKPDLDGVISRANISTINAVSGSLSPLIQIDTNTTLRDLINESILTATQNHFNDYKVVDTLLSNIWEFKGKYFGNKKVWEKLISGTASTSSYILTQPIANIQAVVEQSGYWVDNSGNIRTIVFNNGVYVNTDKSIASSITDSTNNNRFEISLSIITTDDLPPREQY